MRAVYDKSYYMSELMNVLWMHVLPKRAFVWLNDNKEQLKVFYYLLWVSNQLEF